MGKKTVAELDKEVQELKKVVGNVQLAAGTVWNPTQVAEVIEEYSRYGELVKAEFTIDHSPSKDAYHYQIWHYPLLNRGDKDDRPY